MKHLDNIDETDILETISGLPVAMASFRVESHQRFVLHANNQALRTLLKTDNEEAYDRDILELQFASEETLRVFHQLFQDAYKQQESFSIEQVTQLRDESRVIINYTVTPLVIKGAVPFILAVVRDITELVRTRMQRQSELAGLVSTQFVVCAWCSAIRDKQGVWMDVDRYVSQNSFKRPLQTLCPDCTKNT